MIIIQKATSIMRHKDGTPYAWISGETIHQFNSVQAFVDYVDVHIAGLHDCIAFSGSASLISSCNAYMTKKLKEFTKG